jgi:hypothetical protein
MPSCLSGCRATSQEGGYNVPAIQHGMHACVATLLGVGAATSTPPAAAATAAAAAATAQDDIAATIEAQRPYWSALV